MSSTRSPSRGGVKLTEVLAFVGVALLVAALIVPRMRQSNERARQAKVARDIEMLSTALDKYRVDNSRYPTTDQGLDALRDAPTATPVPPRWAGPYVDRAIPSDPWGKPYLYACPGKHNARRFDLSTLGADSKEGGRGDNADIGNWE